MHNFGKLLLVFTLLAFINSGLTFGANLSLTKIGALDTAGAIYTEWWYTGSAPLLVGTASTGTAVTVKVDGITSSATPDASGNWQHQISQTTGDPLIVISQGSDTYSFTLHLGQSMPSQTGTTQQTTSSSGVPATGKDLVSWSMIGLGFMFLSIYFYISSDFGIKKSYEKKFFE